MTSQKPVLAISISTGWAVRNFFQTGIIGKLQETFQVLVFTTTLIRENLLRQGYDYDISFVVRDDLVEPLSWKIFRQIKKKIYMESRKSSTEAIWEKYVKRPFYQKIGGLIIPLMLRIFDASRLLTLVENLDFALNNSKHLDRMFEQYKPAMFFATHASTYFEESLLHSSVKAKVPAIFMVLSWDHLSSKIVLSNKYKSVYVWNNLTKKEIQETCPKYSDNQIQVVGVPQYDIYAIKPEITYAQWCEKYGLDPDKRTVTFCTMPQVRHGQQHLIIEQMLMEIENGKNFPLDIQLLIKCHPFDNENKYDYLTGRYPVVICKSTLGNGETHEKWFPCIEEMFVSRDIFYFSDININIFSTVTLESAYFDKPIIHIAFDPIPVKNRIPCHEYYNFDHFINITNMQASIMAYSYEDLFKALNIYLNDSKTTGEQRNKLVKQYFNIKPGLASSNVVKSLVSELSS